MSRLRTSDLKSALAHYSRALELQPNDADASLGIGKTLKQERPETEAAKY